MPEPPKRLERSFAVRWAETDADGRLRPAALIDWMQEAAAEHATLLGVGMAQLAGSGLGWVLARLALEAPRWPGPGEAVALRTWPSARDRLSFLRDFELLDAAGAPLARATTTWVVFDLARRRPARAADLLAGFVCEERRALADPGGVPPEPAPDAPVERFVVRRSDLDVNRHANNAAFLRWALDAAPAGIADAARPAAILAVYRGEAFAGDTVAVRSDPEPGAPEWTLRQQIARESDGRELARLRVRWERR